jgi:hypothetical protein
MAIVDRPSEQTQEAELDPTEAAAHRAIVVADTSDYDAILEASFPASDPPPGPLALL